MLRAYLMVNPAALHGLDLDFPHNVWPHGLSVVDEGQETIPDIKPFLIDLLAPGGEALCAWWARHCVRANNLALIASPLPAAGLGAALRERMKVRLDDGSPMLLRLFDTRVLANAPRLLSKVQWRSVCDGIAAWAYADRDGQLRSLALAEAETVPVPLPLRLSDTQVNGWIAAHAPDQVRPYLGPRWAQFAEGRTACEAHELLSHAMQRAQDAGLTDIQQWVAYCEARARLGSGFEDRAPWSEAIAKLAERQLSAEEFGALGAI